jgi:hypothetical protein
VSTDWIEIGSLYPWGGVAVDAYLTPEACQTKALDCLIRADTLDDPRQKAAMLRYAEWWNRLAEYRGRVALNAKAELVG